MNKDRLTITIDTLLMLIKNSGLIVTGDDKYSVYLKKVSESTVSGKSYEIIITDKKWNVFEEIK